MDRRYLIAGLFFVAAAIIATVLAYPKYQVVKISSQLVSEKQEEFTAQNVLVQEISKLKSRQKQMTDEAADVADLLPLLTVKSVPDLFVELEALAAESGLLMDSISFNANTKQDGQKKADAAVSLRAAVTAQLKMKGKYADMKYFMKAIETNKHLMDVITASVASSAPASNDAKKEKSGDVVEQKTQDPSYTVTIRAYYQ